MAKKKFYAVAVGRECGIFTDWPSAEKQVKGFGAAKYKSFPSMTDAENWLKNPVFKRKASPLGKKNYYQPPGGDKPFDIVIYTDGSSLNNPGPGGYGAVIIESGRKKELSGGFRLTTNNRMEMMAAIVALRNLTTETKPVLLYSDSRYLVNGITKGWAKKWRSQGWKKSDGKDALNIDLWQELLDLTGDLDVEFRWVKGHAGNPMNERCDRLAVGAARQKRLPVDTGYEGES
ncbi:MAG: ribonuclease HI [Deltaproteobacteria bacterium]|nr:ribonuclease HI [Deltaproteobacteria bacterium]